MVKKKKSAINVSQAIRDVLDSDPGAKPAEIVRILKKEHRIDVSAQYVSTIKSSQKKRERTIISSEFESLLLAKRFVQQLGGVDEALKILEDYRMLFVDESSAD